MKEDEMGEVCGTQGRGSADMALARKHEETRRLVRLRGRWVDNVKMALIILLGDIGLHVCNSEWEHGTAINLRIS
jgi:hypothetical protein